MNAQSAFEKLKIWNICIFVILREIILIFTLGHLMS